MEYRRLGKSGLKVPVLSLGTSTFGGGSEFFKKWGAVDVAGATRMVDICLEAGANFFDTANVYSDGMAEEILGQAIAGKRDKVLVATKATYRLGQGANDTGSGRGHLTAALEASLKRLKTDYVDVFYLHGPDGFTPIEETMQTLDTFVRDGKVRYVALSNFNGWQAMKACAAADRHGWVRPVAHEIYYSLLDRDYEWELMPFGLEEGLGAVIWSPLGWGRLSGKIRRGQPAPKDSRMGQITDRWPNQDELLFGIVDVLDAIAKETGKSIPQIALNWLLRRPGIASVIIGARNEEQLKQNLGADGWALTADQVKRLDEASAQKPSYPFWHQRRYPELTPITDPSSFAAR